MGSIINASLARPRRLWLPATEFVVEADIHHLNVSVVAAELIAGGKTSERRRNCKALAAQPNKIVFESCRPIPPERPFGAEASCPSPIAVTCGNGHWTAINSKGGTIRANPGSAALSVKEQTVPCITEAAGNGCQPPDC